MFGKNEKVRKRHLEMKYSEEVEVVMRPASRQPTVVARPSQM